MHDVDPRRPSVEFYRSSSELHLLLPVLTRNSPAAPYGMEARLDRSRETVRGAIPNNDVAVRNDLCEKRILTLGGRAARGQVVRGLGN